MHGDTDGIPASGDHLEIEHKYDVGPDFAVPALTGIAGVARAGEPVTHRLSAVYYDTPDLALAGAKITLRRRTGGHDAGWHLKLPAGAGARREIHAPLTGPGEPVPARLAALVAGPAGGRPLRPVAKLETTRRVIHLTGPEGEVLAEVADDRVSGALPAPPGAGGRWQDPVTWREVEVELGSGGPEVLEAARDLLLRAGARPSASGSKLARLLASAGPAAGP